MKCLLIFSTNFYASMYISYIMCIYHVYIDVFIIYIYHTMYIPYINAFFKSDLSDIHLNNTLKMCIN